LKKEIETMENITKKAMYGALINYAEGTGLIASTKDGDVKVTMDQLKAFAEKELENLEKKAAKAKEAAAKKRAEADELQVAVAAALTGTFEPIADIAARISGEDVTVSKVTYRLTQLVKNGEAEKQEIAVPTGDGNKTRKIMGYRAVAVTEDTDEVETAEVDE
jgi:hypothetical protein